MPAWRPPPAAAAAAPPSLLVPICGSQPARQAGIEPHEPIYMAQAHPPASASRDVARRHERRHSNAATATETRSTQHCMAHGSGGCFSGITKAGLQCLRFVRRPGQLWHVQATCSLHHLPFLCCRRCTGTRACPALAAQREQRALRG